MDEIWLEEISSIYASAERVSSEFLGIRKTSIIGDVSFPTRHRVYLLKMCKHEIVVEKFYVFSVCFPFVLEMDYFITFIQVDE